MDGSSADYSRRVLATDHHLLSCDAAAIQAAERREFVHAVAAFRHKHETDLVHVGIQHHSHAPSTAARACHQDVPQGVHAHISPSALKFLEHDLTNLTFITRRANCLAQATKQREARSGGDPTSRRHLHPPT